MKKILLFVCSAILLSCSDDDSSQNPAQEAISTGHVRIAYLGNNIQFEDPEVMRGGPDSEFDLTVSGYITFEGSHHIKNYIRLPFKLVNGEYELQLIDINDNQFDGTHLDVMHHYVMLAGPLANPGFEHVTTLRSDNHLLGSFSGNVQPGGQEPDGTPGYYVSGDFDIDLNAVD